MDSCSAFDGGDNPMVLVVEKEKPAKEILGIAVKRCNGITRVSLGAIPVQGQRVGDLDKIQWIWRESRSESFYPAEGMAV